MLNLSTKPFYSIFLLISVLSETTDSSEEEWQSISDLATACRNILEALSREGEKWQFSVDEMCLNMWKCELEWVSLVCSLKRAGLVTFLWQDWILIMSFSAGFQTESREMDHKRPQTHSQVRQKPGSKISRTGEADCAVNSSTLDCSQTKSVTNVPSHSNAWLDVILFNRVSLPAFAVTRLVTLRRKCPS